MEYAGKKWKLREWLVMPGLYQYHDRWPRIATAENCQGKLLVGKVNNVPFANMVGGDGNNIVCGDFRLTLGSFSCGDTVVFLMTEFFAGLLELAVWEPASNVVVKSAEQSGANSSGTFKINGNTFGQWEAVPNMTIKCDTVPLGNGNETMYRMPAKAFEEMRTERDGAVSKAMRLGTDLDAWIATADDYKKEASHWRARAEELRVAYEQLKYAKDNYGRAKLK